MAVVQQQRGAASQLNEVMTATYNSDWCSHRYGVVEATTAVWMTNYRGYSGYSTSSAASDALVDNCSVLACHRDSVAVLLERRPRLSTGDDPPISPSR